MKILYYDCFAGISGDMNLGALIDLGVSPELLTQELAKLNLSDEFELHIEKKSKNGIMGTKVDVIPKALPADTTSQHDHAHPHHSHEHDHMHTDHTHEHGHHSHEHDHAHTGHAHVHPRNFGDISNIISKSAMTPEVKALSMDIFTRVAEAEGKVHGKPIEEVHFHEVGAIDSIIDIIGSAICLIALNVDQVIASPIQVGGGFVKCAHGIIPVPAPATVEILKGIPIHSGLVQKEMTTPTGAAIIAAIATEFTEQMDFKILQVGYGLGTRQLDFPNVLRVYLAEKVAVEAPTYHYLLETNIDDMNPEYYGFVEELLFEAGAMDVFKTPILMKKGRAATQLSVLVNSAKEETILEVIFKHTTSIGLRKYTVDKIVLPRTYEKVSTSYGDVTIKKAYYKDQCIKYKPEYEECKKLAITHQVPIDMITKAVYSAVEAHKHDK